MSLTTTKVYSLSDCWTSMNVWVHMDGKSVLLLFETGSHFVELADRSQPASASRVLRLKVCVILDPSRQ